MESNDIISTEAKEAKSELEDCMSVLKIFDMDEALISSLSLRLNSSTLD